jgi:ribosome-associated protein
LAARTASEGKAEAIVILDVRSLSSVTDYFVIFTGLSTTHLRAVGKRLEDTMTGNGTRPLRVDGAKAAAWMVYDYGNVVVHGMLNDCRRHYDIERLWGDAPELPWS